MRGAAAPGTAPSHAPRPHFPPSSPSALPPHQWGPASQNQSGGVCPCCGILRASVPAPQAVKRGASGRGRRERRGHPSHWPGVWVDGHAGEDSCGQGTFCSGRTGHGGCQAPWPTGIPAAWVCGQGGGGRVLVHPSPPREGGSARTGGAWQKGRVGQCGRAGPGEASTSPGLPAPSPPRRWPRCRGSR